MTTPIFGGKEWIVNFMDARPHYGNGSIEEAEDGSVSTPPAVNGSASAIHAPSIPRAGLPGNEALKMHLQFLHEVLAEVTVVFANGAPSVERLSLALTRYWDASFERRNLRLDVMRLAEETATEQNVEPLGRPFIYMVVSELWPKYGELAPSIASEVYWKARDISLDEAFAGTVNVARRDELLTRL